MISVLPRVAVRSSGLAEDGVEASAAGQNETLLGVRSISLVSTVSAVYLQYLYLSRIYNIYNIYTGAGPGGGAGGGAAVLGLAVLGPLCAVQVTTVQNSTV